MALGFYKYKAEAVADYVAKHTDGAGFDVVFDSVGAENMLNSFEAAALNGHVASTVSLLELDLTLAQRSVYADSDAA